MMIRFVCPLTDGNGTKASINLSVGFRDAARPVTSACSSSPRASCADEQTHSERRSAVAAADTVLSIRAAADLVGISRPYLVARIDAGDTPLHQEVGNQRRILKSAVLAWYRKEQTRRRKALGQLGPPLTARALRADTVCREAALACGRAGVIPYGVRSKISRALACASRCSTGPSCGNASAS